MQTFIFLGVILLFSFVGLFFPEVLKPLKGVIVPLLIVIMLSMGLTLKPEDFRYILKKPTIVLYGALLQFTVMPVAGYITALVFNVDRNLLAGFVLVGSAPGGTASNLITFLSKGDLPYSISMTATSTLLSPLFTPLWTWFLAGKFVPVPFVDMALATLKIVVAPVVVGMGMRVFLGERVRKLEPLLPYASILAISLIIGVIFALNRDRFSSMTAGVVVGVLLHNITGFLLGYLLGRLMGLDSKLAKTLSIEVGMQNSGLSTVLALKFFSPLSALPSAFFSLSQNVIGVLLAGMFRRL